MKCYMCEAGNLENKSVEHKLYGVTIGRYSAEVCDKCGEIFYDEKTSDKIEADTKAKGLYGLSAKAKITGIGDSLGITINKQITKFMKIKKGDTAIVRPDGSKRIIVELTS